MAEITLRMFRPDDIDWLVQAHQRFYTRDEGFDDTFGPLVREILEDFADQHDPMCERGWIAVSDGRRLGSIFCVRLSAKVAKLRLFFLEPEARGAGLGKRMLQTCMHFAQTAGYDEMQLWTHESHRAACALYANQGWSLECSKPVRSFGVDLIEQSWRVMLR